MKHPNTAVTIFGNVSAFPISAFPISVFPISVFPVPPFSDTLYIASNIKLSDELFTIVYMYV